VDADPNSAAPLRLSALVWVLDFSIL
jgi:hypothetical protein